MCVCVFVCVCAYQHTLLSMEFGHHANTYMCTRSHHIYTHKRIHMYARAYMHVYTHTPNAQTHMHTCTCLHVHTYSYNCIHAHTRVYTHTRTYGHTHTHTLSLSLSLSLSHKANESKRARYRHDQLYNTLQHTATHCDTLRHTVTEAARENAQGPGNGSRHVHPGREDHAQRDVAHVLAPSLHHTTTHCNTLQHPAPHCTILNHTATEVARANAQGPGKGHRHMQTDREDHTQRGTRASTLTASHYNAL